ncbi:hypothetical protein CC80DRAFT_504578 [Byssothecium circinans]|uniref:Uncharacterized protein n=1 Tax=Byssothecium circinans TaxID=147558 RepID=A0A6A5TXG7_9PLEO|nr:hypothetical protein CC80DRAFT_504578 [Byssothecium circinans]
MPEKTVWRMRAKHRPKDLKTTNDDISPAEDTGRRPPSWRKTVLDRPETPAVIVTDEGGQGEALVEANTPRRSSRPKLVHYLSGLHSKEHLKHIDPTEEWWNEIEPAPQNPLVDPQVALQSTYAHMRRLPSRPIPVSHFSGLFQLFEDYRKTRDQNETLTGKVEETSQQLEKATQNFHEAEVRYQLEIRRLELFIAHGTSGMAGLVKARMDSVVKRKKVLGRKSDLDGFTNFQDVPVAQLEEQIKARTRNIFRQRPASPSSHMVALSRRFSASDSTVEVPNGTPPTRENDTTLSRKVQSELNLGKLVAPGRMTPQSLESDFSWTGDSLPDEQDARLRATNPTTESDNEVVVTPKRPIRHAQSQPLLGSAQKRRRHFSFEPGDDFAFPKAQMETPLDLAQPSQPSSVDSSTLISDVPKSKIPSPVQRPAFGSARRDGSMSSLQSLSNRLNQDNRRESKSSVMTAFRENSRGSMRPVKAGPVHAAIRAYEKSKSDSAAF